MKRQLRFLLLFVCFRLALPAQDIEFDWVRPISTPTPPPPPTYAPGLNAAVLDFTTDAAGNSYLAGMHRLLLNFGAGTTLTAAGMAAPLFVAKFDPAGNLLWTRSVTGLSGINPGGNIAYSLGVAVDTLGRVYLAGELPGNVPALDFGNGLTAAATCSGGCTDVFIARLDAADGTPQWVKTITGQDFTHLGVAGVVAEPDGDFFIGGDYGGETLDFGYDSVFTGLQPGSMYLTKFNPDGEPLWVRLPLGATELTLVLVRSPAGHVYLNGKFAGELDLGNNVFVEESPTSAGMLDFFIAEYDADGVPQRALNINSPSYVDIIDMAIDRQNRLYVATDFDDVVYSGQEELATSAFPIHANALLRYENDAWTLVRQLYYTNPDEFLYGFQGIAIDSNDRVFTGGWYDDSFTGVPGPPLGLSDLLLTCSHPVDTLQWMVRTGGVGGEAINNAYYGKSMSADAAGNLYLAGEYRGGMQLGAVSMGGYGLFVARISAPDVPAGEPAHAGPAIDLSPNPTAGTFTLSCPPAALPADVTVRDVHGRACFRSPVAAPQTTFAPDLPAGIYFVEFAGKTGTGTVRMVVR